MKNIFLLILVLCYSLTFSQTNCNDIKTENDHLKKLLNLYNDHKPSTFENLEFTFFRAIGDIKKQTVTVEFLVKNTNVITGDYYVDKIEVIDELNSSKELAHDGFGTNYGRDAILLTDVEQKYTCIVEKVAPSTMSNVKYITFKIVNREKYLESIFGKINGDKIEWK